ncbi:hypothetical protein GobsT_03050 [Gemmata obscuriglobus]|uniref:DUF1559 domain-containing protein n=1 Tax=Gemmata obscuriglobus TaxID=114 RepID=A0A2Z3H5S6_9BACT|nr:hypothetical protein [Gemmata obscuriglobus]AWM41088.1 hypothetical protein C1280_31625 [Gemmata obscuriglobus]QEG25578.1 hypothetical protein GobsT_03050 [Gemmata obscuriglobus]VTR99004.1 Uncharacterized protein OS=Singulisphaera acidiphila (strain ATCC BAA-1392 / DSM 18658 / VKM B-2454 / MOB10) GN=Sinac_5017 PE=4 SV=1 [Gemmata obscuriglobus UQM 2246]
MSDEDLLGYVLDLLTPEERAAVETRLSLAPELAARLDRMRRSLSPLLAGTTAERDNPPEPPPGLAVRAIARVAQHVVAHEPRPARPAPREPAVMALLRGFADAPGELEFGSGTRAKVPGAARPAPPVSDGPEPAPGRRLRAEIVVAAGIAFLAFGLVTSGIAKARQQQRVYACQNSLRGLHTGLSGYADSDPQGRYPQIDPAATADTFAASLGEQGHLPAGYRPGCPGADAFVAYTYTLGFREPDGRLLGLRRPDPAGPEGTEHDTMPISADFPTARAAPGDGPVSPHSGCMNVLFVGGNVRATTSPFVGPNGDDIYRNAFGHVGAGMNRSDAVLGRPGDRP